MACLAGLRSAMPPSYHKPVLSAAPYEQLQYHVVKPGRGGEGGGGGFVDMHENRLRNMR